MDSHDEILSIEAEIYQMDIRRATLLQRRNVLRSRTSVLPPEILSLVFQHYCVSCEPPTKYDPLYPPLFLGSVSHAWRQIAWSTPQVWLFLRLYTWEGDVKRSAELLDLYLTNVCDSPITLSLEFHQMDIPFNEDPVAEVFFREGNLKKLGDLEIISPPIGWLYHLDGPFSKLVKFHLAPRDRMLPVNTPFLTNTPVLRELSLERLLVPPKAPWSLITTLKLGGVSAAFAVRCLLESPNLIQFHYDRDHEFGRDRGGPPEIPSIFTLPHLEIFSWPVSHNHTSDLLLHRIRLPALRSLTWTQRGVDLTIPTLTPLPLGIWTFLRNMSSAPLTTLCLCNMPSIDITLAKHIYHQIPQIETLILKDCTMEVLKLVLALLDPGWGGEGQADGRPYLTKLKVLELKGTIWSDSTRPEGLEDIIADLLIGRADPSLCININTSIHINEWKLEKQKKLRELKRAGTRVQLLQYGQLVDWL